MRHVPQAPSPPQTWLRAIFISMAHCSTVFPAEKSADAASSMNVSRGIRRLCGGGPGGRAAGLYGTVCHIGTSYQRRRFDVMEPQRAGLIAKCLELSRGVIAPHGMVSFARSQVLPHGEDVHTSIAQIAGHGKDLRFRLAEPQHDARLGQH